MVYEMDWIQNIKFVHHLTRKDPRLLDQHLLFPGYKKVLKMNFKRLENSTTMQREPYLSRNKARSRNHHADILLPRIHHDLQPTTNVSKSNSTNKQNTSNPSSHTHTFHAKSSQHKILSFDSICRSISCPRERDICGVRRRYQVRVDGKQKSSSCEGDSGSEDETRAGTIEEIPNSRVREGEGETELEG
jgi:hypothetical protein